METETDPGAEHGPVEARATPRSSAGSSQSQTLMRGDVVGDFQVERFLGRGGMGEVLLARDTVLGRKVVLKLVHAKLVSSESVRRRFLREAQTTAKFSHPHIVSIYAAGETRGVPYVALEYVEGQSLAERLRRQPPSQRETLRMMLAIVDALREAHSHGVLHRDIKPSNIVVGKDGRLRVLDFGLALTLDPQRSGLASSDAWAGGTPSYMAPEQWRGEEPTAAVDVWAVGVMLYELLSGRRPFDDASLVRVKAEVCSARPAPRLNEGGAELEALVAACLDKDPAARPSTEALTDSLEGLLSGIARRPGAPESPFRGLRAFGQEHAPRFFGREAETDLILERLREEPRLVLAGASGVGKSSLVAAGVIPRMREKGALLVLELRPSDRPFVALASRLLRGDTFQSGADDARAKLDDVYELAESLRASPALLGAELRKLAHERAASVLLFVDQLEELVTLVPDVEVHARFMEALTLAADDPLDPVRIVLATRDDFLGRLAAASKRAELHHVMVLTQPDPAALRRTLIGPLDRVGYTFEDEDLVTEMVAEVEGERASLPLLSFAAEALWNARDDERRVLLRRVHETNGGVAGALGRHADLVLEVLPAEEVERTRTALLRLVTADHTRRLCGRAAVTAGLGAAGERVIDRLVDARLITVLAPGALQQGDAMLELAHESLLQHWPALRRWIEESSGNLTQVRQAEQAAALWDKRGRRDTELWRDPALGEAERALARVPDEPAQLARDFVGLARRHERRRARLRWGAVAAALLVSIGLTLVFWIQNQNLARSSESVRMEQRRTETAHAQSQHRRAEALREGARAAYVGGDVLEARAKVRMALEIEDSAEARTLWWQLEAEPLVWRAPSLTIPYDLAFSPDGRWLAVGGQDRGVRLFEADTRRVRLLRGHADQVFAVAFSPDGRALASGSWSGEIRLWDVAEGTGRVLAEHHGQVSTLAFHPDGRRLAAAGEDGVIRLWDAASGELVSELSGHSAPISELRFDAAGGLLVSVSADDSLRVWDAISGRELLRLEGAVTDVALSADGRRLATASSERGSAAVQVRAVADGELIQTLTLTRGEAIDVAFSPDGERLHVASSARAIESFDVSTGALLAHLETRTDPRTLALSHDGHRIGLAAHDQVQLWDTRVAPRERPSRGHGAPVRGLAFSADGTRLLSGGWDSRALLWDVSTGAELAAFGRGERVEAVAFDPSAGTFAVASREIGLYDSATGLVIAMLAGHTREVMDLEFSPDGRALASSSTDTTARVWTQDTGWSATVLEHDDAGRLRGVSWHPNGRWVAASGDDHVVRLWEARTGRLLRRFVGHTDFVRGVRFSPDGRRLVSGGWDHTVRVWDVASAETIRQLGPLPGRVLFLDVSPDGARVAIPGSDGVARVWDVELDQQLLLEGHRDEVNFARFSRDGALLATSSDDGTVRVWDARTGEARWADAQALGAGADPLLERLAERGVSALARADDGTLLVGYADGGVARSEGPEEAMDPIALELSPPSAVQRLLVTPAGTIAVGHANGDVGIWDLSTGVRLEHARLHGAVVGLALIDGVLRARSELGDTLAWDLSFLERSRCELLREVWRQVVVVWTEGHAESAATALEHPCQP